MVDEKATTTKKCPLCGNENLVKFAGSNEKGCDLHPEELNGVYYFPWELDEGQRSICSNNRDKTIAK